MQGALILDMAMTAPRIAIAKITLCVTKSMAHVPMNVLMVGLDQIARQVSMLVTVGKYILNMSILLILKVICIWYLVF